MIAYRFEQWLKNVLRNPWKNLRRLLRTTELIVLRTANKALPFVNIDHSRLYPPKASCASTIDWISQFGGKIHADIRLIDGTYTARNKTPKTIYGHVRESLLRDQEYLCPSSFVAVVPNGRVLPEGIVITPDDQLLDDVSVDFRGPIGSKLANISRDWQAHRVTDVNGAVAVLATAGGNLYYHWLFQLLPRIELIKRAGWDLAGIDHFLVNTMRAPYQRESLEALAIDPSKIIDTSSAPYLRARKLIVPSVPLSGGCYAPWMCEFLRRTFLAGGDQVSSGRRVYILRGKSTYRRVLNEPDVIQFLSGLGFEALQFETLTVREQAAAMASSNVVVAPHGGGLSNLVFCSPQTKVIEIFSPELVAGYYWKLSNQLGLDYYYMLGRGPSAGAAPDYVQSWDARADIDVDLQSLGKTLALAGIL